MKIHVNVGEIYAGVSKILPLSRYDKGNIYLAPEENGLLLYSGSPSSVLALIELGATCSGRMIPFSIDGAFLNSFLSILNNEDTLIINVRKMASFKTQNSTKTAKKQIIPDPHRSRRIDVPDDPTFSLSPNQFRNLSLVSTVSKKDGGVFSGVFWMIENETVRTLSTNGFGVGYAWDGVKSNVNKLETFLMPSQVLDIIRKGWDDYVDVYIGKTNVILKSKSFVISAIQMAEKSKFPAESLVKSLSGGTSDSFSAEISDLLLNLSAAKRIVHTGEKSKQTTARVTFVCDDEMLRIQTDEVDGGMDLDVRVKKLSVKPMEFTIDGSFVDVATTTFKLMGNNSSYISIGRQKFNPDWVGFSAENVNSIFAFARIQK